MKSLFFSTPECPGSGHFRRGNSGNWGLASQGSVPGISHRTQVPRLSQIGSFNTLLTETRSTRPPARSLSHARSQWDWHAQPCAKKRGQGVPESSFAFKKNAFEWDYRSTSHRGDWPGDRGRNPGIRFGERWEFIPGKRSPSRSKCAISLDPALENDN